MRKSWMLLALLALALLLTGCQKQTSDVHFDVATAPPAATQYLPSSIAQEVPELEDEDEDDDFIDIDFDSGDYDPTSEEDLGGEREETGGEPATPAPTENTLYAGATPVVIDPIDKPTATPVPEIAFTYTTVDAPKLGVSFEVPADWVADETGDSAIIFTNPDTRMDFQAQLTVTAVATGSNYSKSELKAEVSSQLKAIQQNSGYTSFDKSNVDARTLMDATGYYANYTAVTPEGAEIAGRVHVTCLNRTLYIMHLNCPRAYRNTYMSASSGPYVHFRASVKITQ